MKNGIDKKLITHFKTFNLFYELFYSMKLYKVTLKSGQVGKSYFITRIFNTFTIL